MFPIKGLWSLTQRRLHSRQGAKEFLWIFYPGLMKTDVPNSESLNLSLSWPNGLLASQQHLVPPMASDTGRRLWRMWPLVAMESGCPCPWVHELQMWLSKDQVYTFARLCTNCVPLPTWYLLFSECSMTGDEPGGANLGIQVPPGYHGHVIRSLMV